MSVPIVGVGVVGGWGRAWRGLGDRIAAPLPAAVDAVPPPLDRADAFARRIVSRPAVLAAVALADVIDSAGWGTPLDDVGFWMGVGASGGELSQMAKLLRRSIDADGALSLARFGARGLRAVNPLFAFQLMNNFTLCHPAIGQGVRGPNAAFFSRGSGTIVALDEARRAIEAGECARAIAGGADSALHPVTAAELVAEGRHVRAAEGAGLLALGEGEPLAYLERCHYGRARPAPDPDDLDVSALGEALAATPALACAAAVDLLVRGERQRVRIVTSGIDGQFGVAVLRAA